MTLQLGKLAEQILALNVLHREVDEILELAARGFHDETGVTIVGHSDDVGLIKTSENLNFLFEALKVVVRALDKLLLENFDGDLLRRD